MVRTLLAAAFLVAIAPMVPAKPGSSTPAAAQLTQAQIQARDYELAEHFYQLGRQAEAIYDDAFTAWVRTIDPGKLDVWRNRRVFAIEQYTNCVKLNPAHWKAHKRLGLLYNEAGGTPAADELSMMHLIAYLALKPDDAQYPLGKDLVDKKLRKYDDLQLTEAIKAEDVTFVTLIIRLDDTPVLMPWFLGYLASLEQLSRREVFGGLTSPSLLKPGVFTEAKSLHMPSNEVTEGLWHSAADLAGIPRMDRIWWTFGAGEVINVTSPQELAGRLEAEVLRSCAFVSAYIGLMGQMHEFMAYLDQRHINYDPRLPQMLIGQSTAMLRLCFLRLPTGSVQRAREESSRFTQLGGVSTHDLWSSRDYTKTLPDHWLDSGTLEEPDKYAKEWKQLTSIPPISLPSGYIMEDSSDSTGKVYPSESRLATFDIVSSEAYKAWLIWRNVHLGRAARLLGLYKPDDVLISDFTKIGSGELPTWQFGPLASLPRVSAAPTGDRRWLVASK